MRKNYMLVLYFVTVAIAGHGQENIIQQIQLRCDSILNLLEKEKDGDRKAELITAFYGTAIDGFPLQLLSLSKRMQEIANRNNDIYAESAALSAAGQGYRLTGNYVKALSLHRQAVALAEKTGNKILIGFAYNQMGHIYKDRLENEKALTLYHQAFDNFEKVGKSDIWYACMNLGIVYYNMGKYDSALFYSIEAQRKIDRSPGVGNQSVIYANIASVYSHEKKPDSVQKYFRLALNLAERTKSPRYFNSTYISVAESYNLMHQEDSAAYFYKKAVDVVAGTEMNNLVLKPAKKLTEYYQNINADSTVKYWKVYSAANDSVNSIRTNQQIQMLTFEEDQRKRDAESAQIDYQNKIRTGLLLGGLGIFSVIAIILYQNNQQKKKANYELEKTLSELKATQSQLIQSEKMASLGELTAGIAHEIQNPLNFVNNFSEVSTELVDEMNEALSKVDIEEAKAISSDIKQNLEKINHHGKRADAIVKGMLQHSRSSSWQKEPTDINALCDEYLRLAYHGLKAKDKTFDATLQTDFDESIGKINIIPQDIGRVILNLLTNAFYAAPLLPEGGFLGPGYKHNPTVWVSTKKLGDKVLISVRDNGPGIQQNILDKIFQPFFTTKPTGKGTGLGLSLAYDIVKAHGGAIKVETKAGEGTEFIINLPIH